MKIKRLTILFLSIVLLPTLVAAQADRDIFDKAKMDLFDKKWNEALKGLDKIIADFPKSNYYSLAHFYKGKCLEELQKPKEALKSYHKFLALSDNESLLEDAGAAVINLDFTLYEKGEKQYLEEIEDFLESENWTVRNYAAFKLSYAKDKKVAASAVPVLKEIISRERGDTELADYAKIALLRIDPGYLKNLAKTKNREATTLHIKIHEKKSKQDSLSLNIPFVLARLALDAIPAKDKKSMKDKGYDLDRIIDKLTANGDILTIDTEDTVIRIWID